MAFLYVVKGERAASNYILRSSYTCKEVEYEIFQQIFYSYASNCTVCTFFFVFTTPVSRVSELRDIPGNNMEVVIFYVNGGGGERCATASDAGSTSRSSTGEGGSGVGDARTGQTKGEGPISLCLWKPKECES